jgi:hypothetical protein
MPAVGFFVGFYLLLKSQPGHGTATMALGLVFAAVWALALMNFL